MQQLVMRDCGYKLIPKDPDRREITSSNITIVLIKQRLASFLKSSACTPLFDKLESLSNCVAKLSTETATNSILVLLASSLLAKARIRFLY